MQLFCLNACILHKCALCGTSENRWGRICAPLHSTYICNTFSVHKPQERIRYNIMIWPQIKSKTRTSHALATKYGTRCTYISNFLWILLCYFSDEDNTIEMRFDLAAVARVRQHANRTDIWWTTTDTHADLIGGFATLILCAVFRFPLTNIYPLIEANKCTFGWWDSLLLPSLLLLPSGIAAVVFIHEYKNAREHTLRAYLLYPDGCAIDVAYATSPVQLRDKHNSHHIDCHSINTTYICLSHRTIVTYMYTYSTYILFGIQLWIIHWIAWLALTWSIFHIHFSIIWTWWNAASRLNIIRVQSNILVILFIHYAW